MLQLFVFQQYCMEVKVICLALALCLEYRSENIISNAGTFWQLSKSNEKYIKTHFTCWNSGFISLFPKNVNGPLGNSLQEKYHTSTTPLHWAPCNFITMNTCAHSSSFWINHSYTVLQTSLQKCGDIFPEAAFPSSPVLSVSAVWSVVISVSVVFAIAEGGVRSLPRFCSCGLPVGFWAVSLLTALMVATWRLMPVWAAAVPAALILVWVVLQPFNV